MIILSIFAIVFGCSPKTKEELFQEGVGHFKKNNPQGAIVLFKKALEKDPNFFDARVELAKAYLAARKYDQAEKEFLKVLKQNPSRAETHLELARAYAYTNKPDDAIREAETYLQSHSDDPVAFEVIGMGHALKGDLKTSEDFFRKALEKDNKLVSARLGLARVHMAQNDRKGARAILEETIQTDSKNTQAYYMLASLETANGDQQKAIDMYKKISEINPADLNAQFMEGILFIQKGDLKKAHEIADNLKKHANRPEGFRLKGILFFYEKKFDESIAELQKSLKDTPNISAYYFLGLSHFYKKELEQALSQFQKAIDYDPGFVRARLMVSVILLQQKRVDDAIQQAKWILQLDSENALAHNILGTALLAKGQPDEAMKHFDEALEANPDLIDAQLKKGIIHLGKGKTKEAETDLVTAVKIAPELLNTRLILFSYYVKQKDYTKAKKVLEEGVAGNKNDALLYNNIAALLFAQNKPEDGLKYLKKAKDTNPEYVTPYFNLAKYYATKRDFAKSIDEYKAVLKVDNKNIAAMLGTAAIYELQGKDSDALTYYKMAKDTKLPAGYIALAEYYLREKQSGKALDVLEDAKKAHPKDLTVLDLTGRIYVNEKEYKKAVKVYEEVEGVNAEAGLQKIVAVYATSG
ncbi:MAG: Tetratricopeptide 2 repeat protein, partial [Nitrospirae bacterium]|nr:Tetratricopeptide 2 repeat protein [Nitrospirota bacterium]